MKTTRAEILAEAQRIRQQAAAEIASKVEQIKTLHAECVELAESTGLDFSLQDIGLYTDQEASDNWNGSSC